MKLNPKINAFRVALEKFLGFMINQCGIKVNLSKIKMILEMSSLKSIKDVQSLAGKVTALKAKHFQ